MGKKHIVLLHHVSDQGGGTKSLIDIAVMLKDTYDVTVCVPKGADQTIRMADSYGIKSYEVVTPIPTLNVFSGGPTVFNRVFLKGVWRFRHLEKLVDELMQLEPDAVIFNSLVTSVIARKLPKGIKTICFIRETLIDSPFSRLFRDTFENFIDGVAFIAEHEKKVLAVSRPIQTVIPDVLEPTTIEQYKTEEAREILGYDINKFYVLYMGGGARLKGFDTLLKAMTFLDDDYCALIVGNVKEDYFSKKNILMHLHNPKFALFLIRTRSLLKSLNGDRRVKILGYQKEISKLMCASDVIVFPSLKPHQPRPCIEAGMYYKPVILSDFEATKEYFIDGYNALTFKPHDAKDLADKIRYLKANKEYAENMGYKNHDMSINKHDYGLTQNKTLRFIDLVVM